MPRCVRNFWIELDVDGKKEKIATGPKSAGGGFYLRVKVRKEGYVHNQYVALVGRVVGEEVVLELVDFKGKYKQLYKEKRDGKANKRDRKRHPKRVEEAVLRSGPILRSVGFSHDSE